MGGSAWGGGEFHQNKGERWGERSGKALYNRSLLPCYLLFLLNCQNKAKKETKGGTLPAQYKPYQTEKSLEKRKPSIRSMDGLREYVWRLRKSSDALKIGLLGVHFMDSSTSVILLEPAIHIMLVFHLIKAVTCPLVRLQILPGLLVYNETLTIRTRNMYLP